MKRLRVSAFGPIKEADVKFGDLTVLVGPQASGKSLFVQLYKLIQDAPSIVSDLERYGFDWDDEPDPVAAFSSLYFGGGLEGIFGETTRVVRDGRRIDPKKLTKPLQAVGKETVFLIPAQRVLVLQDGWPKPFMAYGGGDPYAIRQFSESIRQLMEQLRKIDIETLIGAPDQRKVVDAAIYGGSKLAVKREGPRRQFILTPPGGTSALPYNVWSAGQREYTLLFLGTLAAEMSIIKAPGTLPTVILEEPEMGLHPQAVVAMSLLLLELLALKIRVIVSTHSPVIWDLVWAIRELSHLEPTIATEALRQIFNIENPSEITERILSGAFRRSYCTYFFNRTDAGVVTQDISSLDPGDDDENIAGWGGLSGFSGRIARIVGEAGSR